MSPTITFRIDPALRKRLKAICRKRRITLTDAMRGAVSDWVADVEALAQQEQSQ